MNPNSRERMEDVDKARVLEQDAEERYLGTTTTASEAAAMTATATAQQQHGPAQDINDASNNPVGDDSTRSEEVFQKSDTAAVSGNTIGDDRNEYQYVAKNLPSARPQPTLRDVTAASMTSDARGSANAAAATAAAAAVGGEGRGDGCYGAGATSSGCDARIREGEALLASSSSSSSNDGVGAEEGATVAAGGGAAEEGNRKEGRANASGATESTTTAEHGGRGDGDCSGGLSSAGVSDRFPENSSSSSSDCSIERSASSSPSSSRSCSVPGSCPATANEPDPPDAHATAANWNGVDGVAKPAISPADEASNRKNEEDPSVDVLSPSSAKLGGLGETGGTAGSSSSTMSADGGLSGVSVGSAEQLQPFSDSLQAQAIAEASRAQAALQATASAAAGIVGGAGGAMNAAASAAAAVAGAAAVAAATAAGEAFSVTDRDIAPEGGCSADEVSVWRQLESPHMVFIQYQLAVLGGLFCVILICWRRHGNMISVLYAPPGSSSACYQPTP